MAAYFTIKGIINNSSYSWRRQQMDIEPANSRTPGIFSSIRPIFSINGIKVGGVAGCSQSKGVICIESNPTLAKSLNKLHLRKAVSSGDTYQNTRRRK